MLKDKTDPSIIRKRLDEMVDTELVDLCKPYSTIFEGDQPAFSWVSYKDMPGVYKEHFDTASRLKDSLTVSSKLWLSFRYSLCESLHSGADKSKDAAFSACFITDKEKKKKFEGLVTDFQDTAEARKRLFSVEGRLVGRELRLFEELTTTVGNGYSAAASQAEKLAFLATVSPKIEKLEAELATSGQ